MNFNEIKIPLVKKYGSDRSYKPLDFYNNFLPHATKLDLKFGYFSTNAIFPIASSMASFIVSGGNLRIMTNHILRDKDKELLKKDELVDDTLIKSIIQDEKRLQNIITSASEHFFSCLKYLKKNERLIFQPVKMKNGGLAHYKEGLLTDSENNIISFTGSCNFTYMGLVENGESLKVSYSWGDEGDQMDIEDDKRIMEAIFKKKHKSYQYLEPDQIKTLINTAADKDERELLQDENEIKKRFKDLKYSIYYRNMKSDEINEPPIEYEITPSFPHDAPYPYQVEAYDAWVENGYSGIFAMATGTGKTITSLNCLLNEYRENGFYRALILVPTLALVDQWIEEVEQFNFRNIVEVSGRSDWRKGLTKLKNDFMWDASPNFVIISTYASFQNDTFQKLINQLPEDTFLIADEAHNIGSSNTRESILNIKFSKKIALSATPKRAYDPEGNAVIEEIFSDSPPYCYSYSMEKAIENDVLNRYFYYPILVDLQDDEIEDYYSITSQLIRYLSDADDDFLNDDRVTALLIKRKNIIHKARGKLDAFRNLVKRLKSEDKLNYCFVYVPEGYDYSEGDGVPYYQIMMNILAEESPKIRQSSFLGNDSDREAKLRGFKEGRIDALVAMKCLDEGVDVPRTEVGIFAASTGNPRQFIQRRGRLLRTHKDKGFSYIYDFVVTPDIYRNPNDTQSYNVERALFKKELTRVAYFASLSENFYDTKQTFADISEYFNLDVDSIIWELKDDA